MYIQRIHIENCWYNPLFTQEGVFINKINKDLLILNPETLNFLKELKIDSSYFKVQDKYLFSKHNNKTELINLNNFEIIKEVDNLNILPSCIEKNTVFSNFMDKVIKYDFKNNNIEFSLQSKAGKFIIKFNNIVCFDEHNLGNLNNNTVIGFNCDNGNTLWRTNIEEIGSFQENGVNYKGEIKKLIGVYNNLLILSLNTKIIALSISHGNLIWENDIVRYPFLYNDKLYVLSDYLIEIDALNGKLIKKEEVTDLTKNKISVEPNRFTVTDEYIYFVQTDPPLVGVLEIKSLKLLWFHSLPRSDYAHQYFLVDAPVVYGNFLTVLDSNNTLHIFEKEN